MCRSREAIVAKALSKRRFGGFAAAAANDTARPFHADRFADELVHDNGIVQLERVADRSSMLHAHFGYQTCCHIAGIASNASLASIQASVVSSNCCFACSKDFNTGDAVAVSVKSSVAS